MGVMTDKDEHTYEIVLPDDLWEAYRESPALIRWVLRESVGRLADLPPMHVMEEMVCEARERAIPEGATSAQFELYEDDRGG